MGDGQISLMSCCIASAAFTVAWRVRIERARPLTWIKGADEQGVTIRHYPCKDREKDMSKDTKPAQKRIIQLTVFGYFAMPLAQ